MPSPAGVRVVVAESLNRDLGKVSEFCDLWGMKLNERRKTGTMIFSRSRTMHPHAVTAINYWRNYAEGSDDLDKFGLTFNFDSE